MRISTKIAAGYGILIGLIFAVLFYEVSRIQEMESINRNLSQINFRAATLSLQLLRDLDQVEEFTRKYYATGGDPGYGAQTEEMRKAFSLAVKELGGLRLSAKETDEIRQLTLLWEGLLQSSRPRPGAGEEEVGAALGVQLDHLSRVRNQIQGLIRTTRQTIELRVEELSEEGRRAARISLIAAVAALLVSIVVSLSIVRSISKPLERLTEGTRAVAEGRFSYRLDETGEDELAQLAAAFNSMTGRLNELDELKKDFVSHVSHELKSPLASVRESILLLLEKGPLTDRQRQLLELNLQSCKRLSSLIENLLDLSRIEAGVIEYDFRRHDVAALVATATAEFEPQVQTPDRLQVQLPGESVAAECDGDRIVQVVGNLLGNALKYAPGKPIGVKVSRVTGLPDAVPDSWRSKLPADRTFALISVTDFGPGVPSREKERIFEKFHRMKGNRKAAGTGLGLAISRAIVEAHGGAIWVDDSTGGGCVFQVLLPAVSSR